MANSVLEGMNLIAKYDPDSSISFHNSQIYFGDYNKTAKKMTKEERKYLKDKLGWFEDEDSWSAFV